MLANVELVKKAIASPIVTMGNELDFATTRHCVNGDPTVFVADVDDNLVHESTRIQRIVAFCKREDWSPLIPSSKLVCVEGNDYLAVLSALAKEVDVSRVEQIKCSTDIDPFVGHYLESSSSNCSLARVPASSSAMPSPSVSMAVP